MGSVFCLSVKIVECTMSAGLYTKTFMHIIIVNINDLKIKCHTLSMDNKTLYYLIINYNLIIMIVSYSKSSSSFKCCRVMHYEKLGLMIDQQFVIIIYQLHIVCKLLNCVMNTQYLPVCRFFFCYRHWKT